MTIFCRLMCLLLMPFFTLSFSSSAYSHALAPSLLQLEELGNTKDVREGLFLYWKTSAKNNGYPLSPKLPSNCELQNQPTFATDNQSVTLTGKVDCSSTFLVGKSIGIHNISNNITPVLVRIKRADGSTVSGLINAENPVFVVPNKSSSGDVIKEYIGLGVEHLLTGYDHVLFVIAIVLLISRVGTLIKAISCFTLGHSISLALSTFNVISLPTGIVEILIAASIVAMALEICNKTSIFERNVWLVATVFGLLHGLGFAAVLSDFNLPRTELISALLSFNVGIEIGQLLVVAVCLILGKVVSLLKVENWKVFTNSSRYVAYAFGSISAFWVIERTQLLMFG